MTQLCKIPKTCPQRSEKGVCNLNIVCLPIIDKCEGCGRVENGYCKMFTAPEVKWRTTSICPMATHIKAEAKEVKKINPLKQSKQAMRNKKK